MAKRKTYIYKVTAKKPGELGQIFYAYARNQKAAVDGLKSMGDSMMKHWHFDCVCFAEADFEMHPELFKILDNDEVRMIEKYNLASAEAYSRRDKTPSDGSFMSKEEVEELLKEKEE